MMPDDAAAPATRPSPLPVRLLHQLGPGLVTSAADDDPSDIATYSQVGAQFGYGLAWTIPFSFPLLAAIQAVSAQIGSVTFDAAHVTALVAILGTTISPYLFFWQAGQEVEEQHRKHHKPLCIAPRAAGPELRRIRTDTLVGMGFSHSVALCIIIATAATLNAHGVTDIATSAQAAEALRPAAGDFAFALFTIGIVGTGLLAVPVLAGSAAYAVSETFGWVEGLDRKPREAKAFYTVIALATLGGVALNFSAIDPIRALFWATVVNGVLATPLMIVMMLIATNKRIMGRLTLSTQLRIGGWISTAVMAAVSVALFAIH